MLIVGLHVLTINQNIRDGCIEFFCMVIVLRIASPFDLTKIMGGPSLPQLQEHYESFKDVFDEWIFLGFHHVYAKKLT